MNEDNTIKEKVEAFIDDFVFVLASMLDDNEYFLETIPVLEGSNNRYKEYVLQNWSENDWIKFFMLFFPEYRVFFYNENVAELILESSEIRAFILRYRGLAAFFINIYGFKAIKAWKKYSDNVFLQFKFNKENDKEFTLKSLFYDWKKRLSNTGLVMLHLWSNDIDFDFFFYDEKEYDNDMELLLDIFNRLSDNAREEFFERLKIYYKKLLSRLFEEKLKDVLNFTTGGSGLSKKDFFSELISILNIGHIVRQNLYSIEVMFQYSYKRLNVFRKFILKLAEEFDSRYSNFLKEDFYFPYNEISFLPDEMIFNMNLWEDYFFSALYGKEVDKEERKYKIIIEYLIESGIIKKIPEVRFSFSENPFLYFDVDINNPQKMFPGIFKIDNGNVVIFIRNVFKLIALLSNDNLVNNSQHLLKLLQVAFYEFVFAGFIYALVNDKKRTGEFLYILFYKFYGDNTEDGKTRLKFLAKTFSCDVNELIFKIEEERDSANIEQLHFLNEEVPKQENDLKAIISTLLRRSDDK